MSYLPRYIPPIYVDLNLPATPSKHHEDSTGTRSTASTTTFTSALEQASSSNSDPRPSCTNSLLLDLLEFPFTAIDPNSDVPKHEHNLHNDGHDTPLGATQQQIYPLPTGHDVPSRGDQEVFKIKQSRDPEVLEEVKAFPAAVFTNTTILASRSLTTSNSSRPARSSVKASSNMTQRGGRTSQFSAKQRRERHNANERRRTNAAKGRVREMRESVDALLSRRSELTGLRDAEAAVDEVLPHRRRVNTVVSEGDSSDLSFSIPGSSNYLDLVQAVDELRNEKRYLEEQLDQLDSQNSALQAVQTELVIDGSESLTIVKAEKSRKRKRVEADNTLSDSSPSICKQSKMDTLTGGYCIETEAVPSFLKVLFPKPMTCDAAFNWVKDSYSDIMKLKAQQKQDLTDATTESSSVLGWREDKREVRKVEGSEDRYALELMLTQDLPGVVSGDLVFNTWKLLTTLDNFQKLFPLTKDLVVLQTINDDCVVVRVGIAPAHDAPIVHSMVVLARGQIDGGYLVSMRSVPMSLGQKAFAAQEEAYLPVLAWFMLLDKYDDEYVQPVCEVIVGTSSQHNSERMLHGFATELVAGVVRWQDAVGQKEQWEF